MQHRPLRQLERVSISPIRYDWNEDQVSFALVTEAGNTSSYKKTIEVEDSDKWAMAIKQEMESLEKNQT